MLQWGCAGRGQDGGPAQGPFSSLLYLVLQQVLVTPPQKHTPGPSPPHPNLGDSDRQPLGLPLPACLLTAATTSANQTMALSYPLKEELSPQAAPTQPDGTHFQWLSQQTTPNVGLKTTQVISFSSYSSGGARSDPGFSGLKIGAAFLWRSRGESVSSPFLASRGRSHSLARGHISHQFLSPLSHLLLPGSDLLAFIF